jgi:predicted lipid-binding transport protein (Tim44 family)
MSKGLMGGLLGGALGGMLLGSMFGMGGSGMGILPMLLLGVAGYFLYKRFVAKPPGGSSPGYRPPRNDSSFGGSTNSAPGGFSPSPPSSPPPPPQAPPLSGLDEGLAQIRENDSAFDTDYFVEIASDVFFKVQAGWMRRDLSSYGHLLGSQLSSEYDTQFADMKAKGEINKLENISIRNVKIVDAGSNNGEDFVTVLFTANLLDYTVDDKSGDLLSGSMTDPVKFAEEWSWARPVGTEEWKLEGIKEV